MRLFSFLLVVVWAVAAAFGQPSVGLVVEHGDGGMLSRCVPADSVPMGVFQLLDKAGIVYAATAGNSRLTRVDGESAAPGAGWYLSRGSAAGATLPQATQLDEVAFTSGDVAYLQHAVVPRETIPASYPQACDVRSRAALVVVHSSGEIVRRCVTFPGLSTTAGALLDRSGVPAVIATFPFGRAICSIDGEGCPEGDCFGCDAQGRYWGLFVRAADGTPVASNYGADQTTVLAGDVVVFYYAEFGKHPPSEAYATTCGHDAQLSANLHVLDAQSFAVVATADSPYALGDATQPARLRLVLPPGLTLLDSGDPASLDSTGRRDMAAAWVVAEASPEPGRVYRVRVQLETAGSEEHAQLGWRASGGRLSDLNHDGRVDKDDLLILRREWEP